jgi:hypothetical protein
MMAEANTLRMVFQAAQAVGDPLGVWETPPVRQPQDEAALELAVWQVALPSSPRSAQRMLTASQRRLQGANLALPAAEARLAQFASYTRLSGLQYSSPAASQPAAEASLQIFLRRTQSAERKTYGLDDLIPQIKELMEASNRLAQNIRLSLASYALVESRQTGRLLGRTRVSWLGAFASEWQPGDEPQHRRLHRQVVLQALATRQSWVRIGLAVAAGGASLASATLGNPLALLGVFQFVRQVIREFQENEDPTLRG